MWKYGWVLLVAVAGSGCVHRFECTVHGGRVVRQVETEHFVVTSDLDEDVLVKQASELEQLWQSWVLYFQHAPDTTARLSVVLGSEGTSADFLEGTAGFVKYEAEPLLMSDVRAYDDGAGLKYSSSNAHEMAHLVSHFWLRRQPKWLAEGLASYLDDATFVRQGTVRMGRWQWGGTPPHDLDTMWRWGEMREVQEEEAARYDSAWAWYHFFSNKEEARLLKWLATLRSPRPARESFEAIFPREEWKALHARLQSYLREGRFRGWETRDLTVPKVSTPRVLEPWEVHLVRRKYADGAEARRAETRHAVALAGTAASAAVVLARYETELRGPQQSEVLAELPDDPRASLQASFAPDLSPLQRFDLSKRAVAALPDDVAAQVRFAKLAMRRDAAAALAAAQRGAALAPWWSEPYYLQAQALMALGRCEAARSALDDVRSLVADNATGLLREVERAESLVRAKCKERKP